MPADIQMFLFVGLSEEIDFGCQKLNKKNDYDFACGSVWV
jgi:hypothetical protein